MWNALVGMIAKLDPMVIVLSIAVIAVLVAFWRAQRDAGNSFNVFDLVMENGKASKTGMAFMIVLGVTTWTIIDLQLKGKLEPTYLLIYCGAWVTPLVAKVIFGKDTPPVPPEIKTNA